LSVDHARPPVVLIVPTHNEAGAIGAALRLVPRPLVDQIIVADGGSVDGTASEAQAVGAQVIEGGRGYGRACWRGALEAPADAILVYMDGDGSDRADFIENLIAPILADEQDFVIASRTRGQRAPGSMGLHQLFIGLLIGRLIKWRYGIEFTDMCAFRAIRRRDLLALGLTEMTYGWNLEMQMRAAQARLRILEIPVPYECRVAGQSKVSGHWWGTVRASTRLLLTFLRIASQRVSPSNGAVTLLFLLAGLQHSSAFGQQPAPAGIDQAVFAAKRFPQPVRVGDLIHRTVLEPKESRPVLGYVAFVIRLDDGSHAIVVEYGGLLGLGARPIAVPLQAMVLLGAELEILDFTPEQLNRFPTYAGAGRSLGADDVINMGLAHPSH
jgi:Glycosyl transferase family 2